MKKRLFNWLALILSIIILFKTNTIAQDVTPDQDGDLYSFQVSNVYFEVDADFGARISSLKLGESELLFTDRAYGGGFLFGSTMWHSPQSEWGWPPATVLDEEAYSGGVDGNSIVLTSGTENNFNVSFTKTFTASTADTSVKIIYNINNEGSTATTLAAWSVTRVPAAGVTFWPMGEGSITGALSSYTTIINEVAWYGHDPTDNGSAKFFSDGSNGWFAHVNEDSILFIKQFADVAFNDQAPGEGEIELWLTGDHAYIELENQGEYIEIPAGYQSVYEVKWYVRKLPEAILPDVGNQDLVDYVNAIIGDPIEHSPVKPITPTKLNEAVTADMLVINGTLLISGIPAGNYILELFDLTGKLLLTKQFQAEQDYYLNLNNRASGLHIYQISGNNYSASGKLIIKQ